MRGFSSDCMFLSQSLATVNVQKSNRLGGSSPLHHSSMRWESGTFSCRVGFDLLVSFRIKVVTELGQLESESQSSAPTRAQGSFCTLLSKTVVFLLFLTFYPYVHDHADLNDHGFIKIVLCVFYFFRVSKGWGNIWFQSRCSFHVQLNSSSWIRSL